MTAKRPNFYLHGPVRRERVSGIPAAIKLVREHWPTANCDGSTGMSRTFHVKDRLVASYEPYYGNFAGPRNKREGGWLWLVETHL